MAASLSQMLFSGVSQICVDPDDTLEARLQKTVLITSSLLGMGVTFLWAMMYLYYREPLAAAISLVYTGVTFAGTLRFLLTRRYRMLLYSQLILGLCLPFLQLVALGGFLNSGAVVLWSLTSPLGALLLLGPRQTLRWWLAFLFLVFLSGLLEPFLRPANNLPSWLVVGLFVGNIIAVSSIAILMLVYFVNQKNFAFELLRIEEEKAENLLLNILPKEIAPILKNENRTIAERFEAASILFADLAGFTELSARLDPEEMVDILNEIFSHFDGLVEKHGVEKIRTIGDNYMVVAGAPRPRPDHAQALARVALEMNDYICNHPKICERQIEFRFGINSGPVIGGVVGRKKFVYDVWGDAVNIASRMESHGLPRRIQISNATYELVRSEFLCEPRGKLIIKGKGEMETWILVGANSD
jgi:guanylate cyclase